MVTSTVPARRIQEERPARRPRRRWRWLRRLLVVTFVGVFLVSCGLVALLALTPSARDAPQRTAAILAAHHDPSDQGVVPKKVGEALLATEDSRFYQDPALDPQGTARAAWGTITGNANEGGATIEIQLAKLLYTPGRSGLRAQVEQVGIAIKLDADFTKRQILAMYLNAAYFGDGAYGITAASTRYFAVAPAQLTWGQAALLAGLVQAPSAYNPHSHLHLALRRRRHVLARLVATHVLGAAQARRIARQPLHPAVSFSG